MQQQLTFAFLGNEYRSGAIAPYLEQATNFLAAHHAQLFIEPATLEEVDFVLSMGGDGTFLRAVNRIGAREIPIIGVNMGRLGFLADVHPEQLMVMLSEVLAGHYTLENHTVIQLHATCSAGEWNPFALNDIAILKRDTAAMIRISARVDGALLGEYQADGLIVATPTGSTAYSLSNGGPIIVPQSGSLCLTPVAPHSLNLRPIVINDSSKIDLEVESRSHSFLVAIDGRSMKMADGVQLSITKAQHVVKVVKLQGQSFFTTLREKLMWGVDQR